nr:hypothetical protein [Tanacetum cinerariifolium]
VDIEDHSFSPNSKIELFLFNPNHYISSVRKGLSQYERNFSIFFHFENNEISREGLRVSRDSFAYKEYGIRLMMAPRSARALHEKVLLKLHRIRKLPGSLSSSSSSSLSKLMGVAFCWSFGLTGFRVVSSWVWLSVARKGSKRLTRLLVNESVELSFKIYLRGRLKGAGGKNWLMKAVQSLSHVLIVPSFNSSSHFLLLPNGHCGTESQSDNTVDNPHVFIIYWIIVLKGIEKVVEVIDVKNWRIDNYRVLRMVVCLFEWNSLVSLTKSLI